MSCGGVGFPWVSLVDLVALLTARFVEDMAIILHSPGQEALKNIVFHSNSLFLEL